MKVLPSQEFTDKGGWLKYKWRSAIQCIEHSHIVDLDLVVVGAGHQQLGVRREAQWPDRLSVTWIRINRFNHLLIIKSQTAVLTYTQIKFQHRLNIWLPQISVQHMFWVCHMFNIFFKTIMLTIFFQHMLWKIHMFNIYYSKLMLRIYVAILHV